MYLLVDASFFAACFSRVSSIQLARDVHSNDRSKGYRASGAYIGIRDQREYRTHRLWVMCVCAVLRVIDPKDQTVGFLTLYRTWKIDL